jgi:hypothetical protein
MKLKEKLVTTSYLWRLAPILVLAPLALIDCGGSDNSDINGDPGHPREAGAGPSADAPDARSDVSGPTPGCPPVEPEEGRNCPASTLVCLYGDRWCVCSTGVPWSCFDVVDAGSTRDGSGGAGGAGGMADGGAIDSARPPDGSAGRGGAAGATADAQADTARDTGRGGGGAGGTGGAAGARDAGRDGTVRDVASDTRDAARDGARDGRADVTPDATPEDANLDDAADDGSVSDDAEPEGGADAPEGGEDAGDDGG